jgi:hypothetical protein
VIGQTSDAGKYTQTDLSQLETQYDSTVNETGQTYSAGEHALTELSPLKTL